MAKPSDPALLVHQLDAGYGHVRVIRNASVTVAAGDVVGLVGRNGAGKSTFINAVAGLVEGTSGSVGVAGRELRGLPAHERTAAGVALVPSGGRLFRSLTVAENLAIGLVRQRRDQLGEVFALFPELLPLRHRHAGFLSGGERQMVAIGRALLLSPRLLLLDEPSEGLAPIIVLRLAAAIRSLPERGIGLLIAEQNIKFTDLICSRNYEIEKGLIHEL